MKPVLLGVDLQNDFLCEGNLEPVMAAAIFSTSPNRIADFLRRARAGILKINGSTANAAVDLPFGSWKASGMGSPTMALPIASSSLACTQYIWRKSYEQL